MRYTIYTDGGASHERGAWAYSIRDQGGRYWEDSGVLPLELCTSQRAELYAAIRALSAVPWAAHVTLYSDSQYLVYGMRKWIFQWLDNGWLTAEGKPVKNQDLFQELLRLAPMGANERKVKWVWVPRDSDEGIRRADQLVNEVLTENNQDASDTHADRREPSQHDADVSLAASLAGQDRTGGQN